MIGIAEYRRQRTALSFTHTEVDATYGGRGVAQALARAALDTARSAGLAVRPYGPFIAAYIRRHPAGLPLVPVAMRATFDLSVGPTPSATMAAP